ncbi:MAG: flagellar assembly protein FliH [Gammaproteobacteria bacterium]|nr:flagellar assembly protein FliH [Gammaproteobacteria bacterium]MDH5801311.1 flagellar assembly protein FliH [Gammaproteobacteria bacterium]
MNTSKIMPRGSTDKAKRWTAPNVEGEVGLTQSTQEQKLTPVTAEAIEKIQNEAYKEAYDEGYGNGYKEGINAGSGKVKELAETMEKALNLLSEPFAELDRQMESEIVTLAALIAKQLVRREIKTDPAQIVATVREAVLVLPVASRNVNVYLQPEDAQIVRDKLNTSDTDPAWRILEDPVLERGDCRITTESSSIDATLEKRLASIVSQIMGGEREQD